MIKTFIYCHRIVHSYYYCFNLYFKFLWRQELLRVNSNSLLSAIKFYLNYFIVAKCCSTPYRTKSWKNCPVFIICSFLNDIRYVMKSVLCCTNYLIKYLKNAQLIRFLYIGVLHVGFFVKPAGLYNVPQLF